MKYFLSIAFVLGFLILSGCLENFEPKKSSIDSTTVSTNNTSISKTVTFPKAKTDSITVKLDTLKKK